MSYSRFLEGDAYIYDHVKYGLVCDACLLSEDGWLFIAGPGQFDLMLAHIERHRDAGHFVPLEADRALIRDRDRERH